MPARSKDELLAATLEEYARLDALIAPLSEAEAMVKDEDNTSIKDVVGHRAHWIDLFLGWHADGLAGKDVAFPAPGYKWNDLKAYNARLREAQSRLSWTEARSLLTEAHAHLLGFIAGHDDGALYGGPMQGARNDWTTGRWAEANGPSHYRSASKYIRQILKSRRS
ncbi:hypothetical protein LL06_25730 [Hoeflea sp. BAL378]|uniref:ClbS/DfsB family four-helix bundle protein n=1 Tax=Hoeflea sp. BAL378 TaxID=1547437 RepID=UPI000512F872|nr:ClbS/DfsB family four-helix bundle protein [Hoeflea sp. BAL378]KGF66864.1 hypothetical protein LL06_25730 [Hoeflea sp. BAL378]